MASNSRPKTSGAPQKGPAKKTTAAKSSKPKARPSPNASAHQVVRPAQRPVAAPKAPAPSQGGSRLGVVVDGRPLDDDAARKLWVEFSIHMDENVGDLAGFAALKGWAKLVPEHRAGRAVLVVSTK